MLVRLARQGSVAACEELIRRYQDRVYTLAYGYLHDPEEALDITQEILLQMVEGLPRFREQVGFHIWLYRIVVHRCIDRRRPRRQYRPPALQDLASERGADRNWERQRLAGPIPADAGETPALPEREQIQAAIAAVPEIYRIVVILADIEGLSSDEIAEILGCPVNMVKTRLHHGRMAIRQRWETFVKDEEGFGRPSRLAG
jgi:RNA polymerase sigma-70 factor (ECF subfamily)